MKVLKMLFYVDICVLIIETIGLFFYNKSVWWLVIMLLAFMLQVCAVNRALKQEDNLKEKKNQV